MSKKTKKFFNNKPWKNVKTRKVTFILSIACAIIAMVFGACMIFQDKFDSATWFSETLDFLKWVITTGVLIVTVDRVEDVVKIFHGVNLKDEEDSIDIMEEEEECIQPKQDQIE